MWHTIYDSFSELLVNLHFLIFLPQVTSFREPSIPPPPAPTRPQETAGQSRLRPPIGSTKPPSSSRPPVPAQPNSWLPGRAGGSQNSGVQGSAHNSAVNAAAPPDDDWDDSWDEDDDSSSYTTETQVNQETRCLML
jgi:hypothetical protein